MPRQPGMIGRNSIANVRGLAIPKANTDRFRSERPIFAPHQPQQIEARNAHLPANIGNEVSALWVALFCRWCFLRDNDSSP